MKYYSYNQLDENNKHIIITVSEDDIIAEYWDWWYDKMIKKFGEGHEWITRECCIDDYVVVHWAWEIDCDNRIL